MTMPKLVHAKIIEIFWSNSIFLSPKTKKGRVNYYQIRLLFQDLSSIGEDGLSFVYATNTQKLLFQYYAQSLPALRNNRMAESWTLWPALNFFSLLDILQLSKL